MKRFGKKEVLIVSGAGMALLGVGCQQAPTPSPEQLALQAGQLNASQTLAASQAVLAAEAQTRMAPTVEPDWRATGIAVATGGPTVAVENATPGSTVMVEPTKAPVVKKEAKKDTAQKEVEFTCDEVGIEDPTRGLVLTRGFSDQVPAAEVFNPWNINAKYGSGYFFNKVGFARTLIAEPGTLMESNPITVNEAPFTMEAGTNGFTGIALQEGIITIETADGQTKQILARELQGAMHEIFIRDPFEGSENYPMRITLSCIVPGHVQVQRFAEGTFVSAGQAEQIVEAGHSSVDSAGLPTNNCGGDGCERVTVTSVDPANTGTVEAQTQVGVGGEWKPVLANFGN